jgi:hypothetical protein
MIDMIGVCQPLERAGYAPLSIKWARAVVVNALVMDPPYQRVSGVAGVSGRVAYPKLYMM